MLQTKLLQTFMYKSLCEHMLWFPLGIYLGAELRSHILGTCLTLLKPAKLFSQVVAPFHPPTGSVGDSRSHHVSASGWCGGFLLISATLTGTENCLTVDLFGVFLMTNDTEHPLTCAACHPYILLGKMFKSAAYLSLGYTVITEF